MAAPAPAAIAALRPDADALRAFWAAVVRPGNVHELRIPQSRAGPLRLFGTVSGYFDDGDAFVSAVQRVTGADASAVYITLNPVNPAMLARACNRLQSRARSTAGDGDVVRRRLLLIDVDPVRDPKDVSATEAELAAALARRDSVQAALGDAFGWPDPVASACSGNGGALLYAVDLPNDDQATGLIQRVLAALDAHWSDDLVKVDVVNYNAARITKVIGTVAAKGENLRGHPSLEDRPWRLATATYPTDARIVSAQCLEALAAEAPQPTQAGARTGGGALPEHAPARTWTMDELLAANGLHAQARSWQGGGTKYPLEYCLTSPDHADGACLIEMPSGAVVYRCHHDRCAGKGWLYLREHGLIVIPGAQSTNGRNGRTATGDTTLSTHTTHGAQAAEPPLTTLSTHTTQEHYAAGQPFTTLSTLTTQRTQKTPALHDPALHGLAGEIVKLILPQTEAHKAALLANLLVFFGSAAGRAPHGMVGTKRHGINLFAVLVGRTSGGRKGSSLPPIEDLMARVDGHWLSTCVKTGLASGEGLISEVRDAVTSSQKDGSTLVLDEGIGDKRLLVIEEEWCRAIKVMARESNTLSAVIRQFWDGANLAVMTRHNPMRVTAPHVSILGQITQPELHKYLTDIELANGFANRFLWVHVEQSNWLPDGGGRIAWGSLVTRLHEALQFARSCVQPVERDEGARALWHGVYRQLRAERDGLWGAVTARAEAQTLRLSIIYALLDQSPVVRFEHLEAALALWQYCEDSARMIFGDATGDSVADRILAALRDAGKEGLDLEATYELLQRHVSSKRRQDALDRLVEAGHARSASVQTEGRSRTVYYATGCAHDAE